MRKLKEKISQLRGEILLKQARNKADIQDEGAGAKKASPVSAAEASHQDEGSGIKEAHAAPTRNVGQKGAGVHDGGPKAAEACVAPAADTGQKAADARGEGVEGKREPAVQVMGSAHKVADVPGPTGEVIKALAVQVGDREPLSDINFAGHATKVVHSEPDAEVAQKTAGACGERRLPADVVMPPACKDGGGAKEESAALAAGSSPMLVQGVPTDGERENWQRVERGRRLVELERLRERVAKLQLDGGAKAGEVVVGVQADSQSSTRTPSPHFDKELAGPFHGSGEGAVSNVAGAEGAKAAQGTEAAGQGQGTLALSPGRAGADAAAGGQARSRPSGGAPPGPPPKAKAKGAPQPPQPKGKGKGKSKPSTEQGEEAAAAAAGAKLVNLHWRASLAPKENEISAQDDEYLAGVVDFLPQWGQSRVERCKAHLASYERAVGLSNASRMHNQDEAGRRDREEVASAGAPAPPGRRMRRKTIFSGECLVEELPPEKLEEFFQARSASFDISSRASCTGSGVNTLITDPKHRQILDILVKKEAILRFAKLPQQAGVNHAVDALVEAVKRCDYTRCTSTMLEDLRKVALAHLQDSKGQTIVDFVEVRGKDALQTLEHPHLHRLLLGVIQIPAIIARLDCMILECTFCEHVEHCVHTLEILHSALQCVLKRLGPLRRFFATALRFGNALNLDSNVQIARYGFKLSSLMKFLELRTPLRKEVSLMHFVILWMDPSDVGALSHPEATEALHKAKAAYSHTVYQDLLQQLEGYRSVQQLVETGKYKGQEIPTSCVAQRSNDNAAPDVHGVPEAADAELNNVFHARMRAFVQDSRAKLEYLCKFGLNVFEAYRDLAAYLDDLKMVYPPPKEEKDDKMDLFVVLHQLFSIVAKVSKDIEEQGLVRDVVRTLQVVPPLAGSGGRAAEGLPPEALSPRRPRFAVSAQGLLAASAKLKPCTPSPGGAELTPSTRDASPTFPAGLAEEPDAGAIGVALAASPEAASRRAASPSKRPSPQGLSPQALPAPALRPSPQPGEPAAPLVPAAPPAALLVVPPVALPKREEATPPPVDPAVPLSRSPMRSPMLKRTLNFSLPPLDDETLFTAPLKSPPPPAAAAAPELHFAPALGPPPRRHPKRAPAVKPAAAPSSFGPAELPVGAQPPSPAFGVLGTTPLRLSLGLTLTGVEIMSPQVTRSTSPRTRLGRKSLTRIVDRVTSQVIKVSDGSGITVGTPRQDSSPRDCGSPSQSSRTSSEHGDEDGPESSGNDLSSQLRKEMRRRRSSGRPSTPNGWFGASVYGSWGDGRGFDSPRTSYYPLTPVKEQGETPYRLADFSKDSSPASLPA